MSERSLSPGDVRAMLDQMGIRLGDDAEYDEVALRLSIVLESVRPLMTAMPAPAEALVPADLPRPRDRGQ